MAPEVIQGGELHGHGKSADMWSFGCIILELMTLCFSWEYEFNLGEEVPRDRQCVSKILAEKRKKHYSNKLEAIVKRLLSGGNWFIIIRPRSAANGGRIDEEEIIEALYERGPSKREFPI